MDHEWTDEEQAVLVELGLTRVVFGVVLTLGGRVWFAQDDHENGYALKSIKKDSFEIRALQRMRSLPSPRNRTIPGRLFECRDSYVFVMPKLQDIWLPWARTVTWEVVLDHLYAVIDFIQFMHENNIAFVDVSTHNTVWSPQRVDYGGFDIAAGELYFIDFGAARILPAGPGSGIKIHDFRVSGGKWDPPEGMDVVDPYAYDVFCLGSLISRSLSYFQEHHSYGEATHVPRIWFHFATTLDVKDHSRRPSIFRARRQFSTLRVWTSCTAWLYRISPRFADVFEFYGWRLMSFFVR